mmetsp:Transcript_58813/g.70771  ORF Transcript_58813/g.70771 Transcript_58813/m.70771 type:complete len:344 (-) Transcript_58813:267-1298(-)
MILCGPFIKRAARTFLPSSLCCSGGISKRTNVTLAITRHVSENLANAITSNAHEPNNNEHPVGNEAAGISLDIAKQQHLDYVHKLRSIVPTLTLPASSQHPDCVFVEDTAVVVGNTAVINRIGAEPRRGEEDPIRTILNQLGLTVHDMRNASVSSENEPFTDSEDAPTCDGGDVLYPGGNELFVGLSSRTNEGGIRFLQKSFPMLEVITVPLRALDLDLDLESESYDSGGPFGCLHLKSMVTHIDETTLVLPMGPIGEELFRRMEGVKRGYHPVYLPDAASCNLVSVNGTVLAPETAACCEETRSILQQEIIERRGMSMLFLDSSEFVKCDGALTCKSILLSL